MILTSCGGGGGGNEEEGGGDQNTGNIEITTDADWVAYQDSTGNWHRLTAISPASNEIKTYRFNADNKYGVAVFCTNDNKGNIFNFTKSELNKISYYCEPHYNKYSVSGSFNNLNQNSAGRVYIDSTASITVGITKTELNLTDYEVSNVPEGTWDIIGVELSMIDNSVKPVRVAIKRDINVNGNLTGQNLTFVDNSIVEYSFDIEDQGSEGYGISMFFSKNGTIVKNGEKDKGDSTGKWYRLQNINLDDNDSYVFAAFNSDNSKMRIEAIPAKEMGKIAKNIDLSNITKLNSGSFDSTTKTISGLNYTPTGEVKTLTGYSISLEDNNVSWDIIISKTWLENNSSYTLPDFSSVNGFNSTWWFSDLTKTNIELSAVMTNVNPNEILNRDPKIKVDGVIFKSGIFEIATQKIQVID